jgi:ATP-binding cassette subfamily B protein/subfamily B ATP-binding cassette protein MsbA
MGAPLTSVTTHFTEDFQKPPSIKIEHLMFRYSENEKPILENFNLTIKSGEHIGIIGKSGTGKSTLLGLILGVFKPSSGSIGIDGQSPVDYFAQNASRLGFSGSDPFLIEGSVLENLHYGACRVYTEEEINAALQATSLQDLVSRFSDGLNHRILENGDGLSAGQKQRISLARALLRKPVILILDEVTSNLDYETENDIIHTICNLKSKTTVILISHRKETLQFLDQIIELDLHRLQK